MANNTEVKEIGIPKLYKRRSSSSKQAVTNDISTYGNTEIGIPTLEMVKDTSKDTTLNIPDLTDTTWAELESYLTEVMRRMNRLIRLANNLSEKGTINTINLSINETEPDYINGRTIAVADGSNWNPGGTGAGLYYRTSGGAWTKIG